MLPVFTPKQSNQEGTLLEVVEDDVDGAALSTEVLCATRCEAERCGKQKTRAMHTVTATAEVGTILRALPSLSILQRPAHSPSCLLSSTCN